MTISTNTATSSRLIWEETCDERVKRALQLPIMPGGTVLEADVVVIGAGVSGLSAATEAATLGAKTLLLERDVRAAAGASGRNAGIVCMGANLLRYELGDDDSHDWLWKQTTEIALDVYEESMHADTLLNASRCGSLTLATNAEDGECFAKEVTFRKKMGLEAAVLDGGDARTKTSGRLATDSVVNALWLQDEGRCQPWTLSATLANRARFAGATMYGGADVASYSANGDRWELLLTNGTKVLAKALVRGTGPTVDPNKRIYAMAFETTLPIDFPVFQDAAPFTYFDYRTGDGHIVCTGGPYGEAGDTAADAAYFDRMAGTVRKWIPELAKDDPKFLWAVDLKVTPDMMPQLLDLNDKGAPGFSIVGLGALGVLPGILLGRKAAQKLLSTISD
jgi:glycine/D-amino acid oxidase-like deaminating enzyme